MKKFLATILSLGIAGILNPNPAKAANFSLYFVESDTSGGGAELYKIDLDTAGATLINPNLTAVGNEGLAPSNSNSSLFLSYPGFTGGSGSGFEEISLDGTSTPLSTTGAEGLAYDSDNDILYGAKLGGSSPVPIFFSIDPSTGDVLSILANPLRDLEGLAYAGNGVIYGLASIAGPPVSGTGDLLKYDIATDSS